MSERLSDHRLFEATIRPSTVISRETEEMARELLAWRQARKSVIPLDMGVDWNADTSTIPCVLCGGVVREFSIPNEIWNYVVRDDGLETDREYMCETCYRQKANEKIEKLRVEVAASRKLIDVAIAHRKLMRNWRNVGSGKLHGAGVELDDMIEQWQAAQAEKEMVTSAD